MAAKSKDIHIHSDADIQHSKLDWDNYYVFVDDFDYMATADLVGVSTPWRDASSGGTASAVIPATTLPFGQALVETDALADTGIMTWKTPTTAYGHLDTSQGISMKTRFRMTALPTGIFRVGLYAAADNFALLEYDPSVSAFFRFTSNDTNGAVASVSTVVPIADRFYNLSIKTDPTTRQVSAVIKSRAAGVTVDTPVTTSGAHLIGTADTQAPYFLCGATAAVSPRLFVDKVGIFVPRY